MSALASVMAGASHASAKEASQVGLRQERTMRIGLSRRSDVHATYYLAEEKLGEGE